MEEHKMKELLNFFNKQSVCVQNRLSDILAKVSDGRVPNKDELRLYYSEMDSLIEKYNKLKEEAESILDPEEMPSEGCKAIEYIEAVANSKRRRIELQLEKVEGVLQKFLKVKSLITEYETAVIPFKKKAAEVLKTLSKENVEQMLSEMEAFELFLEAIEKNNQERYKLLKEIDKHYPREVQWGLSGGLYFIDNNLKIEIKSDESAVKLTENKCDAEDTTIGNVKEVAEEISNEKIDRSADEENFNEITERPTKDAELHGVPTDKEKFLVEKIENKEELLVAINKPKRGNPSATSFKKELAKIAKIHKETKFILPLMTNLGVLSKKQIYMFGECMNCIEHSDRDKEKVYEAIEYLVRKGYLACFSYEVGEDKEVYCLSAYCYDCLKKDSISSKMSKFWCLSFGEVEIKTEAEIDKNIVNIFIRNNDRLVEYLYGVKGILEEKEYRKIVSSIKWKEYYYRIDVIKDGETINCCLYDPEGVSEEIKDDEGILVIGNDKEIDTTLMIGDKKIFVYDNQSISPLEKESGNMEKSIKSETIDEIEQKSEKQPERHKEQENEVSLSVIKKETFALEQKVADKEDDIDVSEDISVESLLRKEIAPNDKEFCTVMEQLLNREVAQKEDLSAIISQTIVFAKAVGDVVTKENGVPKDYVESYKLSAQLRLASNLMLNECVYTSEFMSSVFLDPSSCDSAIMLSAYMFAMLLPGMPFDYGMKNQTEFFFQHYDDYFKDFSAFKPLFNKLMAVKDVATVGFSPAFVSLLGDEEEREKFINELGRSASEYLKVIDPTKRLKSLRPMYSNCFGKGSDLHHCMIIISENKQEKDDVGFVETVLRNYCDEHEGTLSLSNVKIEDALSSAWNKANQKKFELEYAAREQALKQYNVRLEIMLKWVEHINNMTNRKQNISRLKILRSELIKMIQEIQKNSTWRNLKNANILAWTLAYMQQYLNGQVVKLKIYSEFLYTGIITVDDDGIPIIAPDLVHVKYYEPWRNVLRHIVSPKKAVSDVMAEIMGDNLDDKADEEGLKDNLHQLEMLGKFLEDDDDIYTISDEQLKDAIDSANDRTTRFQEKLELAYTYNQINETEKENLIGIVNQYKTSFYEAMDFACWRRFLGALEKQMTEFAKGRKKQLRSRLDSCLKKNLESSLLKEANRLLEEEMNFAVTEEYINRFECGEMELDDDVILHDFDYFSNFIDPLIFDPLFRECTRNNGKNLSNFGWNYVERNMPKDWTSRQKEDSRNLVVNWPKRKDRVTQSQIKTLFAGLGFDVIDAERTRIEKEEVFKITVRQTPKSMADYRHPIASFGTQIKSPINVIMLYGNYTEKQLVDTVSNLDLGDISIVLLDRALNAESRRLIGEIFHTTSGQNPFLLIDQVLFLYLALHQITERMPAMLKCTLPYSKYQPFVRDGGPTSDEMFCGRTQELATIIDPNGACVVYGGRQLGKTALLERAESRCSKPADNEFAVYTTISRKKNERKVVETIVLDINNKCDGRIILPTCNTIKEMCTAINDLFHSKMITSMLLLIDEVDDFLASIADVAYEPILPLVDLKRDTKNKFKFVIAGLHNVYRAKNATRANGIFGQLGIPLCIKPLSPTDALQLISRPLRYLGFQIDRYPHLETILTNTNYYPGILQFFGYMLVETLTAQYSKYYSAADGNPPFTLQKEQLGTVMSSSDLNKSIKDKFRLSLELDQRYFMIARCITMLYHYYEDDRLAGSWRGFSVDEIMNMAKEYEIHCLENESKEDYINLLDEMVEMGILGKPDENRDLYRLRRNSFVDIIGENIEKLEEDIVSNNEEAQ